MKKIYALTPPLIAAAFITLSVVEGNAQNIAINTSGSTAADCAILDVSSSNLGVLIPRISIGATGTYGLSGTAANANGMIVFNTNAGITGIGANGVGFYFWSTSVNRWINLMDNLPSGDWMLAGNSGTTAGTDFIGTTDAQDLVFKRNSSEVMRLYSASNYVGIGTATPGKKLDVQGGASFGSGTYQSGAIVDMGNAGVDYPGNSGWAGSYNT